MILQDKNVVICGVGDGLGGEIAKIAIRDGANLVMGARNEDRLRTMAEELNPSGARCCYRKTDVSNDADCAALVELATERFGKIDALVIVAAVDTVFGGVREATAKDWRACFDVNVVAAANLVRIAATPMTEAGGGSIVLIGSQSMWDPQVMQMAYASSKGALETAMKYMATDLGKDGIRVNMVVPTWMWGPPVESYIRYQAKQEGVGEDVVKGRITARMPLGEIPADEDVAEAVAFFCSDRARMITGQTLMVNSGEFMR
jgi:NAD(P)-dependent dehydrogenase (short-subunit alcohol dehydrogenase family)